MYNVDCKIDIQKLRIILSHKLIDNKYANFKTLISLAMTLLNMKAKYKI